MFPKANNAHDLHSSPLIIIVIIIKNTQIIDFIILLRSVSVKSQVVVHSQDWNVTYSLIYDSVI